MRRGLLTPIAIGAVAVAGLSAWSPLPRELRSSAVAGEDSADPAPATGRVRCKVYDENENPIPDGATLRLRPARRSDGNFVYDDTPHADDACATVRDGSALFERVGLGQELEVVFIDERGEREPAAHRFTGPASPDEETATRIDLRPARPVLTGRLVDTSGRPVVALQVAGDLVETKEDEDASNWFAPTVTDSRGRFRMAFGFRKLPLRGAKLLLGAYVEGADGGSGHHEFASVSLPAVVGAGTTDVGDVVYRGGELLVGGVVVGPDGKPVAGAVVVAMEECGQRLVFQGDLGTYESTDSVTDSDRHWSRTPLSDVSFVETDAEGRFRLLGAPPKQRLHLGVRLADHYMANEPEFQLGAANVRVVMSEAGGIAGSLQVPDGVDPHDLAVSIDGEAARNGDVEYHFGGWMGRGLRVAEDGRFEIRTLRPGTVRVRVHRSNVVKGEALLDFPDVQVVAGMISRDPRLQEMRPLRDVKPLIVTVRDSGGAPVRGAQVSFRADGTKRWSDAEPTGPDGTTRLVGERGRSALRTVVVCGRGFRPAELDGILEDVEFALLPATESTVRLRLAADVSLPSAPFHLTAELHWFPLEGGSDDEIDPRDVRRRARLSSERLVELTSVRPGRYRVALMLHETHRSGAGVGWDFPTVPEDVVVTVPGDGSDVDVWVGIDPAKLRERTSR